MTPDCALKQSIMTDAPPKTVTARRATRAARKGLPFWAVLLVRGVMVVALAIGLRVLMTTPEGEALMQRAVTQVAAYLGEQQTAEAAEATDASEAVPTGATLLRAQEADEGAARPKVSPMPGSQDAVRRVSQ